MLVSRQASWVTEGRAAPLGVWLRVSCRCFRTQLGLGHSKAPQRPEAAVQAAAGRWPRPQFPPPSPHKLTLLTAPCWPPGAGGLHQGSQAGASTAPDSSWEGATWRREDREDSISEHVPRTSPPGFGRGRPHGWPGHAVPEEGPCSRPAQSAHPGPSPCPPGGDRALGGQGGGPDEQGPSLEDKERGCKGGTRPREPRRLCRGRPQSGPQPPPPTEDPTLAAVGSRGPLSDLTL